MKRDVCMGLLGLVLALSSPARGEEPSEDFSGAWTTTFGPLTLEQVGDEVKGSYVADGPATLEGKVVGARLTFTYAESAARGEGWFELAPGGDAFRGAWRPAGEAAWAPWSGTRVQQRAESPFAGVYETEFGRLRLSVGGPGVLRGRYSFSGSPGTLEGELAGDTLTFRWREQDSAGEGAFVFDAKRAAFSGRWRTGAGEGEWKTWSGKRVAAQPGVVWLTVLEAHWEQGLEEPEYSWGDMLRAFLKRHGHVKVRQRRVHDRADLERALFDVAFLPEPTAVLVACHGEGGTLWAGSDRVPAKDVASALHDAPNAFLLHFSSCEVLVDGVAEQLLQAAGRPLTVSGYAVAVDWAGSAVLEFLYLDLILGRGMTPQRAARAVREELRFAGKPSGPRSPVGGLEFRVAPR
ncbi:MAG: hypothetical protein KDD82_00685 [Planctomycetes bacterium]|nr:hypothetical protein [Planctomycetota bacterium]